MDRRMDRPAPQQEWVRRWPRALVVLWLALATALTCAPTVVAADGEPVSVVVTTEVLGAIVGELAGDDVDVQVLMPSGANPHVWEPSARDAERLLEADLIVTNGLDLEQGMRTVLDAARADGVPVFEAADHVTVRAAGEDGEPEGDADDHDHAAFDPHIWTDPLAMRDVVEALSDELATLGVDVSAAAAEAVAELEALDAEVRAILEVIPAEDRRLVTGHESLGYFADRYGFEVIGTVIPGLTTDGEASARELSQLIADVREAGVSTVFAEVGTPRSVAQAVADDSGAKLVELSTSQLPESGSYADFIRDLASAIAEALTD